MRRTSTHPDDYLASLDPAVRDELIALDALISDTMARRSRSVWAGTFWGGTHQTIIGYGDLVQPRPRGPGVDWFIVGLARQKRSISLYVNAVESGRYLGAVYADRLGRVKVGAASIGFARLADIDQGVLRELLRRADDLSP